MLRFWLSHRIPSFLSITHPHYHSNSQNSPCHTFISNMVYLATPRPLSLPSIMGPFWLPNLFRHSILITQI